MIMITRFLDEIIEKSMDYSSESFREHKPYVYT